MLGKGLFGSQPVCSLRQLLHHSHIGRLWQDLSKMRRVRVGTEQVASDTVRLPVAGPNTAVELEIRQPELRLCRRYQAVEALRKVGDFSHIQTAGGLIEVF